MKNGNDVAARVVEVMERLGVDYMVAGSFSSNLYGIPRSTKDADFVAVLGGSKLAELQHELGGEFEFDEQPSFETVTGTFRERVRVPSVPFDIEIFHLSRDAHDQSRFNRRVRVKDELVGREIAVPTAEDVIVTKLRWAAIAKRDKDRDDVRNIIAVQGDEALDWDYIHHWCAAHGTRALLDEIRASIPPIE
ncbi:MAG: hypothetical protein K1X78_02590 [Verrucomicrobiaceae bacterium]|nr:hypothetical protein [Verrucomicrobiaceae bacterium]